MSPSLLPKEYTEKRCKLLIFFIDMSSYLKFHKNARNGLEEKEKRITATNNDAQKNIGKRFPIFPSQWMDVFMKKMLVQAFTASLDLCIVWCDQRFFP
jgi:hypothetical protein